jgi:hypothetical protein
MVCTSTSRPGSPTRLIPLTSFTSSQFCPQLEPEPGGHTETVQANPSMGARMNLGLPKRMPSVVGEPSAAIPGYSCLPPDLHFCITMLTIFIKKSPRVVSGVRASAVLMPHRSKWPWAGSSFLPAIGGISTYGRREVVKERSWELAGDRIAF